jgi:hypothetical protein
LIALRECGDIAEVANKRKQRPSTAAVVAPGFGAD